MNHARIVSWDTVSKLWKKVPPTNPMPAQNYFYDVETLAPAIAHGHEGATHVADYLDLIGQGKIPGHTMFWGFGQRATCSTAATGDDIWEGTATTCQIPDQTVGEQLTIVSTSAADAEAGTGIQTLDMHGLDIAGNPQQEIVTLNGVTPVSTVRTNWRFNQSIHVNSCRDGWDGRGGGRNDQHLPHRRRGQSLQRDSCWREHVAQRGKDDPGWEIVLLENPINLRSVR